MTVPKRLYKYRTGSIQDITNLSAGKIWFADPTKFNDPFDCVYEVNSPTLDEFQDLLKVWSRDGELNSKDIEEISENPQEVQKVTNGLRNGVGKALKAINGVCCFSELVDDLLMWGHYANGHRGFCLEFDTQLGARSDSTFQGL